MTVLDRRGIETSLIILAAENGDPSGLIRLLQSGEEISPEARAVIADMLAGKIKRPRHRPRKLRTARDELKAIERAALVISLEEEGWGFGKREPCVLEAARRLKCSRRSVWAALSAHGGMLRNMRRFNRFLRRQVQRTEQLSELSKQLVQRKS